MIADQQADVVHVSDLLEGRFPTLVGGLRRILTTGDCRFGRRRLK